MRYYEQADHWDSDYHDIPVERQRLQETIALIPSDVTSIADVGCGNGAFLNALPPTYEKLGVDFSEEALKHVHADTIRSDVSSLDLPDKSYDLVTCLEVLEHLSCEAFPATLAEIERVAARYILISVPNQQDLHLSLVTCRNCLCAFNPTYHVRRFTAETMRGLFRSFRPVSIQVAGPMEARPTLPAPVAAAYRAVLREPMPKTAVCPQCGFQEQGTVRAGNGSTGNGAADPGKAGPPESRRIGLVRSLTFPVRAAGRILWRPVMRNRWLLALYEADTR